MDELLTALSYIDCNDYDTWTQVGMALKHGGYECAVWDNWSSASPKYKPGTCQRKWDSFQEGNAGAPITLATVYKLAKDNGWCPNLVFGWDDEISIGRDYKIIQPDNLYTESLPPVDDKKYDGAKELIEYLTELFDDSDHVGYCPRLTWDEGQLKWLPKNGIKGRTAGDLIKALKKGGFDGACIPNESEGGSLIRFNPLDGEGEADRNVTNYKYCLIESDNIPIEKQFALIKELNLPAKFVVHSGKKSLHVICHVDAVNMGQYQDRVRFIYEFCEKNGYTIDKNDKNASRYSRMPGVKRNGTYQRIIARDLGPISYNEWRSWVETQNDNLPKDITLAEWIVSPPKERPILIEGLVRTGDKMIISAPSKAGKSFLLLELAAAIADGKKWLDFNVTQGKVVYVNMELQDRDLFNRLQDIKVEHPENIILWKLRGLSMPMDKLTPILINRYKDKGIVAIIIDPIYKVITGDENNASEMGLFCSYFERIAEEVETAMIYCHHYSKGATAKYANAADRAAGSGVFARDPDAIVGMTELSTKGVVEKYRKQVPNDKPNNNGLTAWEVDFSLRAFAPIAPMRIWFDHPYHRVDEWNFLAEAKYSDIGSRGIGQDQTEKESWADLIEEVLNMNEGVCERELLKNEINISESNLKKNTNSHSNFELGTLEDGTEVVFYRGVDEFVYRNRTYHRPALRGRWK